MNIAGKLKQLADIEAQSDLVRLHFQDLRNKLLGEELREQLDDLQAEEMTTLSAFQEAIDLLSNEIRAEVAAVGVSVKVKDLPIMAVYYQPRATWDSKALDGYAAAHPEILQFRKEGKPSVTIRRV